MGKYSPISLSIVVVIIILVIFYFLFKEDAWNATTTSGESDRNLTTELVDGRIVQVKYVVNSQTDMTKVVGFNITAGGDYVIYEGIVTEGGDNIKWTKASPYKANGTSAHDPFYPSATDTDWNAEYFGSGKNPPTAIPRFPTITDMKNGTVPKAVWPVGTIPSNYGISGDTCIKGTMTTTGTWSCPDSPDATWKYLKNIRGMYLASPSDSSESGKRVIQWGTAKSEQGQLWKWTQVSGQSYGTLCNKHGMCLDASGNYDGAPVFQKPSSDTRHAGNVWHKEITMSGTIALTSFKNNHGYYLQTYIDSATGGTGMVQGPKIVGSTARYTAYWLFTDS